MGEEKQYDLGEIADSYLHEAPKHSLDTTFGIRDEEGLYYIVNKQATTVDNNIIIEAEKFRGTPGLWELIMLRYPKSFTKDDEDNYARLMVKTNALHQDDDPNKPHPKSSKGKKWTRLLSDVWENNKKYEGSGVVVIPSDPNALLGRLDLLLDSQEAGHTGVRNELVSICDELKRQGVLDPKAYKK